MIWGKRSWKSALRLELATAKPVTGIASSSSMKRDSESSVSLPDTSPSEVRGTCAWAMACRPRWPASDLLAPSSTLDVDWTETCDGERRMRVGSGGTGGVRLELEAGWAMAMPEAARAPAMPLAGSGPREPRRQGLRPFSRFASGAAAFHASGSLPCSSATEDAEAAGSAGVLAVRLRTSSVYSCFMRSALEMTVFGCSSAWPGLVACMSWKEVARRWEPIVGVGMSSARLPSSSVSERRW